MKESPVLFCTAMVIALLAGRKTMTRRTRKLGEVGDVLWVRETFANHSKLGLVFKADYKNPEKLKSLVKLMGQDNTNYENLKWKPSIFMPKSACRLRLKLTAVYQEKLQDISKSDAIKEGVYQISEYEYSPSGNVDLACFGLATTAFSNLWQSINGENSWQENPLVWVHEFEIVK